MRYMNIHTHRLPENEEDEELHFLNLMIGRTQASDYPSHVPFSAGIHPWYIDGDGGAQLESLWKIACRREVWMVGEAGLDKYSPHFSLQQTLFEAQARMAEELRKPLVVHAVKCWAELTEYHRKLRPASPWIIHGFRGKAPLAVQLLREGFYLSFGVHYQPDALRAAYPHRFFLETDESPLPIRTLYLRMADLLSIPVEKLVSQVEKNWEELQ